MVTRSSLLREGRDALSSRNSLFEARELLFRVLHIDREAYFMNPSLPVSAEEILAYRSGISRLLKGEPLAYILGSWDFYGRSFFVDPGVLIPRPETESVLEVGLSLAPDTGRALDLCTGSGCIGITLALEKPGLQVFCGDISEDALRTARQNASHYPESRVTVLFDDALKPSSVPYDFIISNPPYIAPSEKVEESVLRYEPAVALWGGDDGLDFYRAILQYRLPLLTPGGYIVVECGEKQSDRVASLFTDYAMSDIVCHPDLSGKYRAVSGQKPIVL